MIIKTNLIPKGFSAFTLGPIIFIKPDKADNTGLLEHEKVHVKQFWYFFPFYWWFYLFDKNARLRLELEAYRVQLDYCENREAAARHFAERLANGYHLNISELEAYELLTCL